MIRYTKSQWDTFPSEKKGVVSHEWCAKGLKRRYQGLTTLKVGPRRLFEGLDYEIVGKDDLI